MKNTLYFFPNRINAIFSVDSNTSEILFNSGAWIRVKGMICFRSYDLRKQRNKVALRVSELCKKSAVTVTRLSTNKEVSK